jgi:hypothetical protein
MTCYKCGHKPRRRKKQTYQPTSSEQAWVAVVFVAFALLFFFMMG